EVLGLSPAQLDALVQNQRIIQTLPVRAPLSGVVCGFAKVLGQAAKAEEGLVEIHNLSRPWVQAFVSERDLGRVGIGQAVRVRFVGDPHTAYTGKVVRSGEVVAGDNRSLSLWAELDEFPNTPLLHQQLATVQVIVQTPAPTLAVPLTALVREG